MNRFTSLRALIVAGRGRPWDGGAASPACRFTLAAALLGLLSPAVHAQTGRPGPPDRPGQPGSTDQTDQTTAAAIRSSWSYSLGLHQAYESDVRFNGGTGNGDWLTRLDAGLGRQWGFRRGSADLSGNANQLLYRSLHDQNRFMYGFGAGVSYDLTRRWHFRGNDIVASSYSDDSTVLTTAGLVFPRVLTRTNIAAGDLTYQLSPRTTVDLSVSETTVTFPASEFSNGSSVSVGAGIARQITPHQSVGISIGNTFSTGITGDIQGLLGTWRMTRGRSLTLTATGGVRPYTLFGEVGRRYAPGGSFGISTIVSRNQTFSASYERAVEQAYGFNRTHQAHRFNANYEFALGQRMTLEGSESYGLNTYPQIPAYTLSGWTTAASVRYLLGHRFSLGAGYGLWLRQETKVPTTSTYRTTFSLTYGSSGR